MKPFEESWQDSGRKYTGRDDENQNERRSFNPNFSSENRLNRSNSNIDPSVKKVRKRIGDTRTNVESNNGGYRPRNNDYQPRERRSYDSGNSGGYPEQRNYRSNNGGYNNNRGNYGNENGDNNGNYPRRNNYNQNNGGYNNNYRNNYNNDRGENRDYNNDRSGYNSQGGQGGGYNRGGYNNNRGGGGYNQGGQGNRRPNNNNRNNNSFRKNNNNRGGNFNQNARPRNNGPIEYRSIVVDPNEPIRLNKFLANAGVCSRREADELIQAGVVSVNGEVANELGTKILRGDKVMIHDQLVSPDKKVYVLLNKPKDCVTTSDDPNARQTVMDLVKNACKERIYPVGRLDRNTTGVLLLTNDGDLASKLTHPKYDKKKIYQVTLDKPLEQADFDTLLQGVTLEDGEMKADDLNYIDEENARKIGIEVHSGKNRIVRRLFEHLGYRVVRLDRVYFAGLTKKNLKRGQWRFLSEKEVSMLRMGAFE
jgi:23S rRNA pseudouridine2605 synthase